MVSTRRSAGQQPVQLEQPTQPPSEQQNSQRSKRGSARKGSAGASETASQSLPAAQAVPGQEHAPAAVGTQPLAAAPLNTIAQDPEAAFSRRDEAAGPGPSSERLRAVTGKSPLKRVTPTKSALKPIPKPASVKDSSSPIKAAAAAEEPQALSEDEAPASEEEGESEDGSESEDAEVVQLDAFQQHRSLQEALDKLQALTSDATVLLRPNQEVSLAARQAAKALYGYAYQQLMSAAGGKGARRALRKGTTAPLQELYTDAAFDPEQIWLQLEPASNAMLQHARQLSSAAETLAADHAADAPCGGLVTAAAAAGIEQLLAGSSSEEDEAEELEEAEEESGEGDEEAGDAAAAHGRQGRKRAKRAAGSEDGDNDDGLDADMDGDDSDELGFNHDEDDSEGLGGSGDDDDEMMGLGGARKGSRNKQALAKKQSGQAGVEDKFMRLSDMEKFMEDAERRAAAGDDDEDVDFFKGSGSEGGEDEDVEGLMDGIDDSDADNEAFGRGLAGSDGGEDDEMTALMRDSAALVGKKLAEKKQAGLKGAAADLRYEDFFGGKPGDEEAGDEETEDEEAESDEDEDADVDGSEEPGSGLDIEQQGEGDGKAQAKAKPGMGGLSREAAAALSSHERRLVRLQEQVASYEAEAMGDKHWTQVGESQALRRPLNSALEVDLDWETTVKPPPQPTEETTTDLETLIKKRITDHKFDDVIRVVPPPLESKRKEVELDDNKASAGLGEVYEAEFVRSAAGGTAEDKQEPLRQQARGLFAALCHKLDALTRFHFAPKPVLQDMSIRSEVAAVVMEEAAPVAVSKASMQLPSEVYKPSDAGTPKAEGEMSREDKKRRRAAKKRSHAAKVAGQAADRAALAASAGGDAAVAGRKSLAALGPGGKGVKVQASRHVTVAEGAGSKSHGRTDMGNSSAVFAKLAAEQAAGGRLPKAPKADKPRADASRLKL